MPEQFIAKLAKFFFALVYKGDVQQKGTVLPEGFIKKSQTFILIIAVVYSNGVHLKVMCTQMIYRKSHRKFFR